MGIEEGSVQSNGVAHDIDPFLPSAIEQGDNDML
jgi:hypothetical protein